MILETNIKENYFSLDVLVNNAAISKDTDLLLKEKKEFLNVLDVNLVAPFLLSQKLSSLIKEASGTIINISSNNALGENYPESIDYDASKAGVVSLTHNFAKVYAPNIRVNSVAPGWIDTDMTSNIDSTFKNEEISKILLGRFACKEEIADAIYFLASNSYINGTVLRIDGGIK